MSKLSLNAFTKTIVNQAVKETLSAVEKKLFYT